MQIIKEYLQAIYLLVNDFLVWRKGGKSLFNYSKLRLFKKKLK